MEQSMWKIPAKYDHSLDHNDPKTIVQVQCDELESETKGRIIAKISQYSGALRYGNAHDIMRNASKATVELTQMMISATKLGEFGEEEAITYEFYITSTKTPQYMYRPFFLQTTLSHYPATIILEQDIADELVVEESTKCNTAGDFKALLRRILGSERISSIVTKLLSYYGHE